MEKLIKKTGPVKEIILTLFSGGLNENGRNKLDRQKLERIQTINAFSFIAAVFIIITYIYYLKKNPDYLDFLKTANGIFQLAVCLSLMIFMRITKNVNVGSTIIIIIQYLLFIFCLLYTGEEGILFIFVSLIPYLAVYLKGAIRGLIWLCPFAATFLFILVLAGNNILIKTEHKIEVLGYMFFGFINLGIFAVVSVYRIEQSTGIIKNQLKEITEMSKIDYLTSVLNKRAFMEILDRERKRTIRHNSWIERRSEEIPEDGIDQDEIEYRDAVDSLKGYLSTFSIVIMDLDRFKDVNDKYGHLFGDDILSAIGEELLQKKLLRENDIVGRFGGEEFIMLLPETNSEQAFVVAERIRERIAVRSYIYENIKSVSITVSMGISEMLISDKDSEDVIKRADRALYGAKESGRNCTKIYEVVNR